MFFENRFHALEALDRGHVVTAFVRDSARLDISHPALTDLEINWGGMAVSDVYPAKIPDMFVGRAIVVTGKFGGPVWFENKMK